MDIRNHNAFDTVTLAQQFAEMERRESQETAKQACVVYSCLELCYPIKEPTQQAHQRNLHDQPEVSGITPSSYHPHSNRCIKSMQKIFSETNKKE
ncbi:hypothetical protein CHS0354_001603 [Potamilus streckersoni]|uniref:Uncharacterized protein n=1 Tax=Potamilus streckersoni TaxID=2493646 RepID=A0AAE0S7R7_9BIVA|nr:hypothetical protein CHS0354_001603 [Potamilus streckersoni]